MQMRLEGELARHLASDSGLSYSDYVVLVALPDRPDGRMRLFELTTGFDPRSGEGARRLGGRYNPPRRFPVIYLCLTRPCVVAELSTRATRQGVHVGDLLPRELWSVETTLDRVLDLTDEAVLDTLGIDAGELVRPDHAFTQQLGEAAHEGQVQAIKSPSATGVDVVLALFPENLGTAAMRVELLQVWESERDL